MGFGRKLLFSEASLPPLGKVAARRADGRGRYYFIEMQAVRYILLHLSRPRSRSATLPKGEGFNAAKLQFISQKHKKACPEGQAQGLLT